MKRIFTSFFILYFLSTANAKLNYNTNEWIDYEKTYYKIKVAENSIYQIDFETLKTNNVPVEIIDGNQLCIFSEGKEIPIYVSNSGKWEEGDYLQFYGERLDGQFDQRLYENPDHQLHTYWSQFTDTAVYFLTVKDSSPKIIEVNNDLENLPEKENYFMHESIYVGYNQASIGVPDFQLSTLPVEGSGNEPRKFNSYLASYAEGEGWVGNSYANNLTSIENFIELEIPTPYFFDNGMKATVQFKIVGGSDDREIANDHHIKAYVNNELVVEDQFEGYEVYSNKIDISINELGEATQLKFEVAHPDASTDRQSISFAKINYPRKYDFNAVNHFAFSIDNKTAGNYLEFENLLADENYYLYDLTHLIKLNLNYNEARQLHQAYLSFKEGEAQRQLILQKEKNIKNISDLATATFTNYSLVANQGDYIIITHPQLFGDEQAVLKYADYRKSEAGGAHKVTIVNVEELYDQYSYGIRKHSLAIKYFLNSAYDNWSVSPKYCFLAGKGIKNSRSRLNPKNWLKNLVPTFGDFPNDQYLGSPNFDPLSNIIIGRLSAANETDILNYLDKVKQVEQNTVEDCSYINEAKWKHNIFHIGGGENIFQANIFAERLFAQANIAQNGTLTANSGFFYKFDELQNDANHCSINFPPTQCFQQVFEEGVQLVNFLGHSSNLVWEVQTGAPTDYSYNNRYPIMISQASFTGDVYKSFADANRLSMPEDWLHAPNAGATAFLSFIYIYEMQYGADFIDVVFKQIFEEKPAETLGEQVNIAMHQHYDTDNIETVHTVNQFSFSGDPALRYAVKIKPELAITKDNVNISLNKIDSANYAIEIKFNFDRLNIPADEPVAYKIILQDGNEEIVTEGFLKDGETANYKGAFAISPYAQQLFIIQLDAANKYDEICEENNSFYIATGDFTVNVNDFAAQEFQIQNHPNPFNEQTVFTITLPTTPNLVEQEVLYLSIANLNGQVVDKITLSQTTVQQQITWDGTNSNGQQLPAGVYWYQLKSNGHKVISPPKKLVLVK